MNSIRNNLGFTLLEIMIATLIFSWIALQTSQALRNSQEHKTRIDEDIDTYQAIRASIQILRRDLSNIHNLNQLDFLPYSHLLPADRPSTPVNLKDPSTYKGYVEQNFPLLIYKSTFIGEKQTLTFTSLSHYRLYANLHESDRAEITFFIEKDSKLPGVIHLYKRESPIIDDKPEEGGKGFLVIEDLSDFQFRFYSAEKDEWVERWNSNDENSFSEIPDIVEIKMVVNSRNPLSPDEVKKIEMTTSIRPLFRNSYKSPGMGGLDSLEKLIQPVAANQGQGGGAGGSGTGGDGTPIDPADPNDPGVPN